MAQMKFPEIMNITKLKWTASSPRNVQPEGAGILGAYSEKPGLFQLGMGPKKKNYQSGFESFRFGLGLSNNAPPLSEKKLFPKEPM